MGSSLSRRASKAVEAIAPGVLAPLPAPTKDSRSAASRSGLQIRRHALALMLQRPDMAPYSRSLNICLDDIEAQLKDD